MWQIFLGLYFVAATAGYLQRRHVAKQFGEYNWLFNGVFYLFFLLPAAAVIGFLTPHSLDIGITNFVLLFLGSLIWPVFSLVAFSANKNVDVGIYSIISNTSPIFTLLIAIPLMGEKLTNIQLFGVALLIVSGVVAGASQLKNHIHANKIGVITSIISAIILGVAIAYERFMLNRVDFGTYVWLGWGSQVIWMSLLAYKSWPQLPKLISDAGLGNVMAFGFLTVFRSIFFISALSLSHSASIVSSAANFTAVLVVISAYFVLKERQHIVEKILAVTLGVVGLAILAG